MPGQSEQQVKHDSVTIYHATSGVALQLQIMVIFIVTAACFSGVSGRTDNV